MVSRPDVVKRRRVRSATRWRIYGPGAVTAFAIATLAYAPAYFGHQTCRSVMPGSAGWLLSLCNWINCHLRFAQQDRTFEAYAAWLAAVSATIASYWAWRSFQGIANQVTQQRMSTFLGLMAPHYEQRLSIAIERIARRIVIFNPAFASDLTDGNELEALAFLQVWQLADPAKTMEWAKTSHEVEQFLAIASAYKRGLDEAGLGVEPWARWPELSLQLSHLRGL